MALTFWKSKYWAPCGVAIIAFAAGLFTAGRLFHLNEVRAGSNRVFELRIYHALPGKLPAMESRFRDTTSKLLVKHDLNVIGYWIPDSKSPAWDNTFVFLLAHSSREEAEKNWREMAADPVFQEIIKSEQKERLLDKADTTYMQPTDFSPMK
jgi:NIPSNAP protein